MFEVPGRKSGVQAQLFKKNECGASQARPFRLTSEAARQPAGPHETSRLIILISLIGPHKQLFS